MHHFCSAAHAVCIWQHILQPARLLRLGKHSTKAQHADLTSRDNTGGETNALGEASVMNDVQTHVTLAHDGQESAAGAACQLN